MHALDIYESRESTWCKDSTYICTVYVSDKTTDLLLSIPHVAGEIKQGHICSLTFAKNHISTVCSLTNRQRQSSIIEKWGGNV